MPAPLPPLLVPKAAGNPRARKSRAHRESRKGTWQFPRLQGKGQQLQPSRGERRVLRRKRHPPSHRWSVLAAQGTPWALGWPLQSPHSGKTATRGQHLPAESSSRVIWKRSPHGHW
jgi:hypothetical protein